MEKEGLCCYCFGECQASFSRRSRGAEPRISETIDNGLQAGGEVMRVWRRLIW